MDYGLAKLASRLDRSATLAARKPRPQPQTSNPPRSAAGYNYPLMCGRFTLRAPPSVVAAQFGLLDTPEWAPRFNIAPTQPVAAIRALPSDAARRQLVWLRWGLVPHWAEDPTIGNRLINARSEGVASKPAFRIPLRRRRCLVLADGFYEWKSEGRVRQPYFIRFRDDRVFAFAGLWDAWEGPDHTAIESCTLLTTQPNALVGRIHDRMPVILAPEHYAAWLDPSIEDPARLLPMLGPYPPDEMEAYAVTRRVNSPSFDDPLCIQPA